MVKTFSPEVHPNANKIQNSITLKIIAELACIPDLNNIQLLSLWVTWLASCLDNKSTYRGTNDNKISKSLERVVVTVKCLHVWHFSSSILFFTPFGVNETAKKV